MFQCDRKVLIITENPQLKNKIDPFFESRGFETLYEECRVGTILKILQNKIDFCLFDLSGHGDREIQMIRVIKVLNPHIPIITLSITSIERVRPLSQAGVFYCALKPVQLGELDVVLEALKRYTSRHRESNRVLIQSA